MLQYINMWVDPCTGNPHWNPLETTTNRDKQLPHSPPEALLGLGRCRMTRPARRATSQLPCQYRSKLDIPRKCIVFWCSIKNGKLYTFHPQNPFFSQASGGPSWANLSICHAKLSCPVGILMDLMGRKLRHSGHVSTPRRPRCDTKINLWEVSSWSSLSMDVYRII